MTPEDEKGSIIQYKYSNKKKSFWSRHKLKTQCESGPTEKTDKQNQSISHTFIFLGPHLALMTAGIPKGKHFISLSQRYFPSRVALIFLQDLVLMMGWWIRSSPAKFKFQGTSGGKKSSARLVICYVHVFSWQLNFDQAQWSNPSYGYIYIGYRNPDGDLFLWPCEVIPNSAFRLCESAKVSLLPNWFVSSAPITTLLKNYMLVSDRPTFPESEAESHLRRCQVA